MNACVDIDAYFRRIGYAGGLAPSLATLRGLHSRHAEAIAFENFDALLGSPPALDPASLQRKLVRDGRGGWCFEQNLLFQHVLTALGFRLTGLSARVLWGRPEDTITPRSHMVLRVELKEGPYVADVGFGGLTLTGPLRLEPDVVQATPHESFRLLRVGPGFRMEARIAEAWKPLYRFDLAEQFQPDYEVSNYYLSTFPGSPFRNNLFAARPGADRRFALFNNEFAVHHLNGVTERHRLASVSALCGTLTAVFGLPVPDGSEFGAVLARIAGG